mmetsp:Transcript_4802/g.6707  ORF Transcript_4802/g.6707 Transcript_4802/m.6707 type:complete len:401 (+) Transcript_4802:59-1261(+)
MLSQNKATPLKDNEIKDYCCRIFNEIDSNHVGYISYDQLKKGFKCIGRDASDHDIRKILEIAHVTPTDELKVDLNEFERIMRIANQHLQVAIPGRTRFIHLNATTENAIKTLIAGGIAGAVSRTAVSPMERLKILYQTQPRNTTNVKYQTVFQSLATILKEEGPKGFFKGNATNCVRIFPTSAIQFYSYEQYKKIIPLSPGKSELTPLQRLLAGGMAGITALVITYPLDFIRARLTIQVGNQYNGMMHAMQSTARNEGILALYTGLWPSILGVVPYVGFDFAVYDTLKRMLPKQPDGTLSQWQTLACGAIAGTVGQTVAYPLDLVRRRLQVQSFLQDKLPPSQIYNGTWDAIVKIVKHEGVIGLYRGTWPNYLKVVPSIAVSFLVFENLKQVMNIQTTKK